MNRDLLHDFLYRLKLGPNARIYIVDGAYRFPSEEWLYGEFAKAWAVEERKRPRRPEKNDCDDIAMRCMLFARDLHRQQTRGDDTLSVGLFHFEGHAVDCGIMAGNNNEPKLGFLEPQGGHKLILPQEKIETCTLLYI